MPKIKYPYVSGVDWAIRRFMDIPDKVERDEVYLRRFIIFKTPVCGLYLHFIYMEDRDQDPHNHPMNFWSFVLRGGYVERRYNGRRVCHDLRTRKWLSLARTTKKDFHQIEVLTKTPTITLIFTGRRARDWGFLTPDGYVPNRQYVSEHFGNAY